MGQVASDPSDFKDTESWDFIRNQTLDSGMSVYFLMVCRLLVHTMNRHRKGKTKLVKRSEGSENVCVEPELSLIVCLLKTR